MQARSSLYVSREFRFNVQYFYNLQAKLYGRCDTAAVLAKRSEDHLRTFCGYANMP